MAPSRTHPSPSPGRPATPVKSADRSLSILELLTEREQGLTFTDILHALGYPRSSLFGLLQTMSDRGWVELDTSTRRYSVGIRAWRAGQAYTRALDLADRALPHMERLRDELGETVQLAVLVGRDNLYVAKADTPHPLALASAVGRRLQAHATGLGKVLLAGLDPEELDRRLAGVALERFTANTITSMRRLTAELRAIRERGWAEDHEEYSLGVHCWAVPVRDHSGVVVAGMSVSIPTVRLAETRAAQPLRSLQRAAVALSAALGERAARPGHAGAPSAPPGTRSAPASRT